MKIFYISVSPRILFFVLCVMSLYAAESNDIFAPIKQDGYFSYATKKLLETPNGRSILAETRVRQVCGMNIALRFFQPDRFIAVSSVMCKEDMETSIYTSQINFKIDSGIYSLHGLAIAAALIEGTFIAEKTNRSLLGKAIKTLEKSRICDLYLLKTALEQDNLSWVKDGKPYEIPKILCDTDIQWPPQGLPVHPVSAYKVVKEALKARMAKKIDDIDMSAHSETWDLRIDTK